jgi:DNA-binding NarL/FixJ family response regulator
MKRPRILVADDHRLFMDGIRILLESHFDIVGLCEDGRALIVAAKKERPDIILVDISMPSLNGFEAVLQLRKATPRTKVIFLTMHHEPAFVAEALRLGASGYVLKNEGVAELATAISEVLKDRVYLSSGITKEAVNELMLPSARVKETLSPRQREVVQLISEGRILKDIAAIMNISVSTVEFHKQAVMRRLGVTSTAEIVKFAVSQGITQP